MKRSRGGRDAGAVSAPPPEHASDARGGAADARAPDRGISEPPGDSVSSGAVGRVVGAVGERTRHLDWSYYVVYIGFIAIFAFFVFTIGTGFLSVNNLMTIVRQTAPVAVMAVGMAFALSAGEIDLSIAGVVALGALVGALALANFESVFVGVAAGLAVGLVVGLLNGIITVKARIPSFLVTLGMLSIVNGLARSVAPLRGIPIQDNSYNFVFGSGRFGPISVMFLWTAAAMIIGHLVYRRTAFGQHVLATGGSRIAAAAVGINTDRIRVAVLMISATTASLAGLLYAGRLHGARYTLGEPDLLTVIAAVVIGGTHLFGGRGSVVGAVVGALLVGMLNNGLILMGLDVPAQMMVRGVIIIIAVALSLREIRS